MIDVACTYILAVAGLYTTRSQVGGQAKLKIKKVGEEEGSRYVIPKRVHVMGHGTSDCAF